MNPIQGLYNRHLRTNKLMLTISKPGLQPKGMLGSNAELGLGWVNGGLHLLQRAFHDGDADTKTPSKRRSPMIADWGGGGFVF